MTASEVPEVYAAVLDLMVRLGEAKVNLLPGCWEYDLGGGWWVAVNGHPTPTPCSRSGKGLVPPYAMFFLFHDLPAGVVDLGGGLLCGGAVGNEAALIRAVKAAGCGRSRPAGADPAGIDEDTE